MNASVQSKNLSLNREIITFKKSLYGFSARIKTILKTSKIVSSNEFSFLLSNQSFKYFFYKKMR